MQDFARESVCPKQKKWSKSKLPLRAAFVKQMVRIMKLIAVFLLAVCLQASARGYTQGNVTLNLKNASLGDVFKKINKQTGYNFLYQLILLDKAHKVSISVKNVSIKDALDICFKDQPLTYTLTGTTIVVRSKVEEPKIMQQTRSISDIKGRVINDRAEPLAGANIVVKRTGKSTITDANGNFNLSNVNSNDIIIVSFVGYYPQSVKVSDIPESVIVLALAKNELDEMVVQAYGTTTRRLATGNITKVTSAEIEKQPVMNPLLALQGKVPGLDIKQSNGYASAPIKVELRGRNLLNSNFYSDPLYVIDGVPLTILSTPQNDNYTKGQSIVQALNGPANGQSPLFSINPNDIESIEVLKDADATAIYGSRGGNGVILITTKKGSVGKTKFNVHVQQGITKVSRFWDLLNTQEYISMRKEGFKNDNINYTLPSNLGKSYDLMLWDTTKYTNWQKKLYGNQGKNIGVQASVSGGNSQTRFRFGVGYNRTTNILTVSGADKLASASLSLNHGTVNQKFKLALSTQYSFAENDMVSLPGKVTYAPNAPSIYDSTGDLNYEGWGAQNSTARRAYPFSNLKRPYSSKTNYLNSNFNLIYSPVKGLNVISDVGYNYSQADQVQVLPISSYDPLSNPVGSVNFGKNNNRNWIIQPYATYDFILGESKFNTLIGGTLQQTNTDAFYIAGSGYANDLLLKDISSAPIITSSNYQAEYKYAAVFGRITYSLRDKYIMNLSGRRDGSSRFGEDKRYGNFGSAGVAWIFSDENWIRKKFSLLSFGKIRASYGLTGNDAIGDYSFLTRWNSINTVPYNGVNPLIPIQHSNPDFHWATNKKFEAAIDLGFWNNRIKLTANYYRNRINDQLVDFPTATFSGFSSVVANSPALVQNDGWEVSAGASLISSKNFTWNISFNLSTNRNRLINYPNFSLSPYSSIMAVGQSLNIVKVLHYIGINPLTGQYSFEDKNKDGQISINTSSINQPDDGYYIDLSPKYFGGFGTNFSYKDLSVSLFFTYKKQLGQNALFSGNNYPGNLNVNQSKLVFDRWQKPGDLRDYARFTTTSPLGSGSDFYFKNFSDGVYTDASFVRLSNLSIEYNIRSSWVKKAGLQQFRIFVNSNNLLLITNYKGIDPETQNFGGLPPVRTIVAGIDLNF